MWWLVAVMGVCLFNSFYKVALLQLILIFAPLKFAISMDLVGSNQGVPVDNFELYGIKLGLGYKEAIDIALKRSGLKQDDMVIDKSSFAVGGVSEAYSIIDVKLYLNNAKTRVRLELTPKLVNGEFTSVVSAIEYTTSYSKNNIDNIVSSLLSRWGSPSNYTKSIQSAVWCSEFNGSYKENKKSICTAYLPAATLSIYESQLDMGVYDNGRYKKMLEAEILKIINSENQKDNEIKDRENGVPLDF